MCSGRMGGRTPLISINFINGRRATVHRDEELRLELFEASLDAVAAQAIAFFPTQGQKQAGLRSVGLEHCGKEGERSDPVYVVITKKDNTFMAIECSEE